ncbi:hypothetical protein [Roseiflexus sp.]|uniref:hypothetical protein n=1 Tax=Roseiflexus sp. TaxID=2562120 RepID=UPI0021DD5C4F|nr:hypothetical protein [Roseiflexus sp.]GIW00724.1 MAG: hypothetical protein KatS3mg058_2127 [Roseiflexus sp.]
MKQTQTTMTPTNPQSLDQNAEKTQSAFGSAAQHSSRRPSQPRIVLQPVVLDDMAPSTPDIPRLEDMTESEIGHKTRDVEEEQRNPVQARSVANILRADRRKRRSHDGTDQTRMMLLDYRISLPGRPVIIGALFICGVIAVALFVTLLLAAKAPIV